MITALDVVKAEFAELQKAVAEMLEHMSLVQEENRALRQQNNNLRDQLRRIYEGDE